VISRPRLPVLFLLLILLAAALALPFAAGPGALQIATRVMILAIFAVSLDFLVGVGGLVSFGHAMFFGLGAYAAYFFTPAGGANALVVLPAAMLAAGIAAAAIGAFAVRAGGFYFILVTFASGQTLFALLQNARIAGGAAGAFIEGKPDISLAGFKLLDFSDPLAFYYFCLAALALTYLFFVGLARTPFGHVVQAVRGNEAAARALGFNIYIHKLATFTIAGAAAGLSGALFAAMAGAVTPDLVGWRQSGIGLAMVTIGGVGTLFGPILGALIVAGLEAALRAEAYLGSFADHWWLGLGIIAIAAAFAAPRGLAGLFERKAKPRAAAAPPPSLPGLRRPRRAGELQVERLSHRFGGLVALDQVSLHFAPNRVHGIAGPHGAGKTTFVDLVAGELRGRSGRVRLDGADIAGLSPQVIARRGLRRSRQGGGIVTAFTVRENCLIAAHARHPRAWRLSRLRHAREEGTAIAHALDAVGLRARADALCDDLDPADRARLEIAMLIASGGNLLILDEPFSGMEPEEAARMTALLRNLAADRTVIVTARRIDMIFAAVGTLTVLAGGRVVAHGAPADVRADAEVRKIYPGIAEAAA
jgi:branched-chain amino acid transport system permease protein